MSGHRNSRELADDLNRRLGALPGGRGDAIREQVRRELEEELGLWREFDEDEDEGSVEQS